MKSEPTHKEGTRSESSSSKLRKVAVQKEARQICSGLLADRLRELRGDQTLYQVQQATGLPRITISRYEKKENVPSIENLRKLADYYGACYKELRILYYNEILSDSIEQEVVLQWALQQTYPTESDFIVRKFSLLSENDRLTLLRRILELIHES